MLTIEGLISVLGLCLTCFGLGYAIGSKDNSQRPRCKQRGIKFAALQSSGVFDPRGSRQMSMQACPLGSLLAGINHKNSRP